MPCWAQTLALLLEMKTMGFYKSKFKANNMKTKLIFTAIFLMVLSACEEDDTIDYPVNTLEANAGSLSGDQLFTGQLLTFDGSQSKDKAGGSRINQ